MIKLKKHCLYIDPEDLFNDRDVVVFILTKPASGRVKEAFGTRFYDGLFSSADANTVYTNLMECEDYVFLTDIFCNE